MASCGMYHVKPYHHASNGVELPTCMYNLKKMYQPVTSVTGESIPEDVESLLNRQNAVIAKLEKLKIEVDEMLKNEGASTACMRMCTESSPPSTNLPRDLVINCDPDSPARAVISLLTKLTKTCNVLLTQYTHSSVKSTMNLDLRQHGFCSDLKGVSRRDKDMVVTWIWKRCGQCEMMVSPIKQTKICGEVNVCRYLMRLLREYPSNPQTFIKMEHWLDLATCMVRGSNSAKSEAIAQLCKSLAKSSFLTGTSLTSIDIIVGSQFSQCQPSGKSANDPNIKRWLNAMQ